MDLDEAIQKHSEWKVKFRSAINKRETLDAATIRQDNCCVLGKWLRGEAKALYGTKASLVDLIAKHADFHRNAAKVADAINASKYDVAEAMLHSGSEYGNASLAVASAITALKKEM